jgi:hypothetical protein
MVLKCIFTALLGAGLLAGGARAADYPPDQFLSFDLSEAVLSPKRLGPAQQFEPVPVEAKAEPSGVVAEGNPDKIKTQRVVRVPVRSEPKFAEQRRGRAGEAGQVARRENHRGVARVRLAHHHGNPLNAEAMDTRIQKWPCNPDQGGICAWRQ